MAAANSPIAVIEGILEAEDKVADFIANGSPDGITGYYRDQMRKRCEQWGNLPGWAQNLSNAPAGSLGRMCKPYLDDNGWDSPTSGPTFTGGQCDELYDIDGSVTVFDNACGSTSQTIDLNGIPGPIGNIGYDNSGSVGGAPPTCPNARGTAAFITNGNGVKIQLAGSGGGVTGASISVSLSGGGSDDCGDPDDVREPGENPPPDPGPTPGPEPTDDPNCPDCQPRIPVPTFDDPVGGPTPVVNPEGDTTPFDPADIPGSGDGQAGEQPDISDAITIPPGQGEEGEDIDFGPPPDGFVWVGALFQITSQPGYGSISGSAPENRTFPRTIGNISLKYGARRGTVDRIRSAWHDISRSNSNLLVTGAFVNTLPQIGFRIYPLKQPVCPENKCTQED